MRACEKTEAKKVVALMAMKQRLGFPIWGKKAATCAYTNLIHATTI